MNFIRQGCMCFIWARYIENREKITCLHVSEHMSDPHDSVWSPQRIFKLHLPVRKKTSHKLCVIYLITFKSFYFFLTWIQVIKEWIHMYSLTDVPDQYIQLIHFYVIVVFCRACRGNIITLWRYVLWYNSSCQKDYTILKQVMSRWLFIE